MIQVMIRCANCGKLIPYDGDYFRLKVRGGEYDRYCTEQCAKSAFIKGKYLEGEQQ